MGIPFAPFLALGGVVALFAGEALLDWYLEPLVGSAAGRQPARRGAAPRIAGERRSAGADDAIDRTVEIESAPGAGRRAVAGHEAVAVAADEEQVCALGLGLRLLPLGAKPALALDELERDRLQHLFALRQRSLATLDAGTVQLDRTDLLPPLRQLLLELLQARLALGELAARALSVSWRASSSAEPSRSIRSIALRSCTVRSSRRASSAILSTSSAARSSSSPPCRLDQPLDLLALGVGGLEELTKLC